MKKFIYVLLVLGLVFQPLTYQAFAFDDAWEEDAPDGDLDDISTGDDQMRQDKRAIRERLAIDHNFKATEGVDSTIGHHKAIHMIDQGTAVGVDETFYNNGGDLYYEDATSNVIRLTRNGGINALAIYPVGSIYISTASTNPATLFGFGTWEAFGVGRVLVGLNSGDVDFDTSEETGGEKTHELTVAEMPNHAHTYDKFTAGGVPIGATNGYQITSGSDTSYVGGGTAHNNLQPYIVVYMWERTA